MLGRRATGGPGASPTTGEAQEALPLVSRSCMTTSSTRRFPASLPSAPPLPATTTSSRPAQFAGSSPASCTPSSTLSSSSRSSSTRCDGAVPTRAC